MIVKTFGGKKITIREVSKADLKNAKKFLIFINALVAEDAKLLMNKKATLKDEREFVKRVLKCRKDKIRIQIIAENDNKIVGNASIELDRWRRNHIGKFGIAISKDYRGIGLGKYMMIEVMKLAKKNLSPRPKVIQLEVYTNNTPGISLYKKLGFKTVAKVPKQIQWKGKLIDELIMIKVL